MAIHSITLLGTGLIGDFYARAIERNRSCHIVTVFSRSNERARAFADRFGVEAATDDLRAAIEHPDTDTVVVGLPNHLHEEAVRLAVDAGKAVLCTKPLARDAEEAKRMLDHVERAGAFAAYLEDLCFTPKTLKAVEAVRNGAVGDVTWVRSREAHPGPHSAWFWDQRLAGGGAIVDLGCHCIEVIRNYVGKDNRPLEVMCYSATMVHPIEAEDNAFAWIRFESGALGQFEVSWSFRGGLDLRDEVQGSAGTIWANHSLRTGLEVFSGAGRTGYSAEKAETTSGWVFPLGDEVDELGYTSMFDRVFSALDLSEQPPETFYDGYVVNCIMDACYRSSGSGRWEPVDVDWRGTRHQPVTKTVEREDGLVVIKSELLPDGRTNTILKDEQTGEFIDRVGTPD